MGTSADNSSRARILEFVKDHMEAGEHPKNLAELRTLKNPDYKAVSLVRVVGLSLVTPSSSPGTLNEAVLQDDSGTISFTSTEKMPEIHQALTVGKFYFMKKFALKIVGKGNYITVKKDMIMEVVDVPDMISMSFVGEPVWTTLNGIEEVDSTKNLKFPNVCGLVQSIAPDRRRVIIHGHESWVRSAEIIDHTGTFRVSLFGQQTELIAVEGQMLALYHGSVKGFNGQFSISAKAIWTVDFGMPGILRLRSLPQTLPTSLGDDKGSPRIIHDINLSDIMEMEEDLPAAGIDVRFIGTLRRFTNLENSSYLACQKCSKRLVETGKAYFCAKCQKRYPKEQFTKKRLSKFALKAEVFDDTGKRNVSIFDSVAEKALSALGEEGVLEQYRESTDEEDTSEYKLFGALIEAKFVFKAKVRSSETKGTVYVNVDVQDMDPAPEEEDGLVAPMKRNRTWEDTLASAKKKTKL